MRLVQSRIVTDDVAALAAFYASLLGVSVTLNDYYVEIPAGPVTVGFSRRRLTEYREQRVPRTGLAGLPGAAGQPGRSAAGVSRPCRSRGC